MERWQARRWCGLGLWEWLALCLWVAAVASLLVHALLKTDVKGSVYADYDWAAQKWLHSADTYPVRGGAAGDRNYRYSPLVTAMLAPFGLLPYKAGEVLWRLLNITCLMVGLGLWMRDVLTPGLDRSQKAILFVLIFPLAIGNVHNAQANVLVLGLLLLTLSAVSRERWGLAAACAALAAFFKVYPICLGLLLASMYPRRFLPRFLVALGIMLLVPFLFQSPAFVARQYGIWFEYLRTEDRSRGSLHHTYVNLQLLFRVWLVPISADSYRAIEFGAAIVLALMCVSSRWIGRDRRLLLCFTFDVACCWMTAFGPATESATYILLAPALAWAVFRSGLPGRLSWVHGLYLTSYALLLSSQLTVLLVPPRIFHAYRLVGPQPIAALLFLAVCTLDHFAGLGRRRATAASSQPALAACAA